MTENREHDEQEQEQIPEAGAPAQATEEAVEAEPVVSSILVRATIKLAGIPLGAVGHVDPRSPYIAACLARGYLVPVEYPPRDPVDADAD